MFLLGSLLVWSVKSGNTAYTWSSWCLCCFIPPVCWHNQAYKDIYSFMCKDKYRFVCSCDCFEMYAVCLAVLQSQELDVFSKYVSLDYTDSHSIYWLDCPVTFLCITWWLHLSCLLCITWWLHLAVIFELCDLGLPTYPCLLVSSENAHARTRILRYAAQWFSGY